MKHEEKYESGWVAKLKLSSAISRISLMLVAMFVSLTISAQAEKLKVEGTVLDDMGEPLIGASVAEKGTTNGTMTDADGKYALSVSTNGTLSFTYLGFVSQEIKVTGKSVINATLVEDGKMLDEVVVTALGLKRSEKALGYAMTELKGESLNTDVVNPVSALQGKSAGVLIAGSDGGSFGSTKIQIRGASTLKSNNQPIYVVDGVILDNATHNADADWNDQSNDWGNALKNLNPNDFETVSVLKGAASTALYGSRGLNGVILITTKGGGAAKGFGVSVNQSIGFEKVNTLPKFQREFGIGSAPSSTVTNRKNPWDTRDFALNNGVPSLKAGTLYWGPRNSQTGLNAAYSNPDDKNYGLMEDYDGSMVPMNTYKDYYKDMFETGLISNTNVAVNGGDDRFTFYNSLGYMYASGIVKNNEFSRISNMLKASYKISNRVSIDGSFTFALSKPKNPELSLGERMVTSRVGPLFNYNKFKNSYKGDAHTGMADANYTDKYASNPYKTVLWDINERTEVRRETSIRPVLNVDVKVLDWLNFQAGANMNYYFYDQEYKYRGTGYMNEGADNGSGGQYREEKYDLKQQTVSSGFTANQTFGDFNIGGFLKGEFYNSSTKKSKIETSGGLVIPNQFFLNNGKKPISAEGNMTKKRMMSIMFAANMGWKNQVYFDVTGRNDWSSSLVYGDKTGDYSYFYPSVSTTWLLNETFKNSLPEWVSLAKLRMSWAQVGNDTDPYYIQTGYEVGTIEQPGGGSIHTQKTPDKVISKPLKPEKKNAWEFGLDFRVLNDRIGLDIAFYKENTKDQIIAVPVPYISGAKSRVINAGDVENKGVEIALNTVPFRNQDWEVTLDFTYTKNKNKIKSLHPDVGNTLNLAGFLGGNYNIESVAQVGGDYGTLVTDNKPKTNEQGQPLLTWKPAYRGGVYTKSGEVETVGSINPDFLGSMAAGVKWKGVSLNVLLDCRYGGYVASYGNRYSMAYGLHENSVQGRDEATGGEVFTSIHDGKVYEDGYRPQGVFDNTEASIITVPGKFGANGKPLEVNLAGMTYDEAIEAGYIDPMHRSSFEYNNNAWGIGTVNDNWFHKVKYIALREITISYSIPKTIIGKIGAKAVRVGFTGRNLGYLYNSLPNGLNPESVRGTNSGEFRSRSFTPNRASYTFNVGLDF